jgi:stage V sporulation protein G
VSEIGIRLADDRDVRRYRILGYAAIVIDGEFLIRDIRIIAGDHGVMVAMPSRKFTVHCPGCHVKNALTSHYCSGCGRQLEPVRVPMRDGRPRLYADIAHPLNNRCRRHIVDAVLRAYEAERAAALGPDYVCSLDRLREIPLTACEPDPRLAGDDLDWLR